MSDAELERLHNASSQILSLSDPDNLDFDGAQAARI